MKQTWSEADWIEWRRRYRPGAAETEPPPCWSKFLEAVACLSVVVNVGLIVGLIGLSQT